MVNGRAQVETWANSSVALNHYARTFPSRECIWPAEFFHLKNVIGQTLERSNKPTTLFALTGEKESLKKHSQ